MNQLQSKYFNNMDEAVKQFDANNKKVIQDFLLEAKVTNPDLASGKKKRKKVKRESDNLQMEQDGKNQELTKTAKKARLKKPKIERLVIPECASDHKMTVSQKVRLETNLRRREELKQEELKKQHEKTWDKHFFKKTQEELDLGLNDPKYLKQVGVTNQQNDFNDPHYDELRGYFLETYKKEDRSPIRKSNIMRKKK